MPITAGQLTQLSKSGAGRLELDADSTATLANAIADNSGDVQVDGAVGEINVNGGSVSGKGTVGVLAGGGGLGSPVVGTISPGDNASLASPIGILHNNIGNNFEQWGPSTTFAVDLTDNSGSTNNLPIAGNDYDQLILSGATNLALSNPNGTNAAVLSGTANANIKLGDQFTILTATGGAYITGKFASTGTDGGTGLPIAYIAGTKFDIEYVQNPSLPTGEYSSVVLIREKQNATMSLASSLPSGSVYGQDVTFTATLTVDNGVGSAPTGSFVSFVLDGNVNNAQLVPVQNNKAVFDPDTGFHMPLSVGSHTISATFVPGNNAINAPTAGPITQKVTTAQTNTTTSLQSGATFVYSTTTPVQIPVLVTPKLPVLSDAVTPGNPDTVTLKLVNVTTNTIFTDTEPLGGLVGSGNPTNGYTFAELGLALGTYTVTLTYNGSANSSDYASSSVGPVNFTVTPDASTVALSATAAGTNSGTTAVFGQLVTFTAVISTTAPGTALPNVNVDLVTFTDNGNVLGKAFVTRDATTGHYVAVLQTTGLAVGQHTIIASYSGSADGKLTGSQGQLNPEPFAVTVDNTQTLLSANPAANWSFNQPITFTATVTAVAPGTGIPAGTVNFYDDINGTSNPTLLYSTAVSSNGTALFPTSGLSAGPHDIYAVYGGNNDFGLSASNHIAQSVLLGTQTNLSSTENPANVGDTVTFIAMVKSQLSTGAMPTGTVSFFDETTNSYLAAGVAPNGAGQYLVSSSTLGFGAHEIQAIFTPSGNVFAGSTSATLTENIRSGTAIALSTTSPNPSAVGQAITLTATVTAVPSANGAPTTGSVTFFSGPSPIGAAAVGATGVAVFVTPGLAPAPTR